MGKINLVISPSQQDSNKTVIKHPSADTEAELTRLIGTCIFEIISFDTRFNACLVPDFNFGDDKQNLRTAINYSNEFIRLNGGKGFHLEIHTDGGYEGNGATGLYASDDGMAFGRPIFNAISNLTPWNDMTFGKRTNLAALNQTDAVAYLQEVSFHDKTDEAYWIFENITNIANAFIEGICAGVGLINGILVPKWQFDSFMEMVADKIITSPLYWKNRLHEPITIGETMAVINKVRKGK